MSNVINLENVIKDYGTLKALDGVTFSLEEGKELVVMGPSGSGKTTLVNLIAGLDNISSGTIKVNGTQLNDLKPEELAEFRKDNVGIIFQQFHLIPYLNAVENVMFAQYFHSMPDKGDAMDALDMVGLKDRAHHLPSELSGGEQQRVAIARAITNDPKLILADEPTGNLDEKNEEIIMDIFKRLKNEGKTLVLVTHNPNITSHADKIIKLEHGRVINGEAH